MRQRKSPISGLKQYYFKTAVRVVAKDRNSIKKKSKRLYSIPCNNLKWKRI